MFHVQLLRLAYPNATNREAGAAASGQGPDPHSPQEVQGLLQDVAVGKCLLQFGDTRVGGLVSPEEEHLQLGQLLKICQAQPVTPTEVSFRK